MATWTFDESIVSDLHKDARGYRPCGDFWTMWKEALPAAKQMIWDNLLVELDAAIEREHNEEKAALASFETYLNGFIYHAKDEITALRWMTDGVRIEHSQDIEGWVYDQGILFTNRGRDVVEKLKKIYKVEY